MQNYKIDILNFVADNYVKSNCSDITFYNTGTTAVTINNAVLLQPGVSIAFSANEKEIDNTIYNFYFDTGVSGINGLTVFRKIYI